MGVDVKARDVPAQRIELKNDVGLAPRLGSVSAEHMRTEVHLEHSLTRVDVVWRERDRALPLSAKSPRDERHSKGACMLRLLPQRLASQM